MGVTTEPDLRPFQDMWDAWKEVRERLLSKPLSHFRKATDIQFDELAQHLDKGEHEAAAREATDIISVALNLMRKLGYTPAEISQIARERAARRKSMEDETTAPDLGPFQNLWDAWEEAREELLSKPLSYFREATDIHFDELAQYLDKGEHGAAVGKATDIIGVALNLMRKLGYTPAEISQIARARAIQRMKGQTPQILDKYEQQYGI